MNIILGQGGREGGRVAWPTTRPPGPKSKIACLRAVPCCIKRAGKALREGREMGRGVAVVLASERSPDLKTVVNVGVLQPVGPFPDERESS